MMPGNEKRKSHGAFSSLQRRLSMLSGNRIFLRVISVLIAVIVWCVMVASEGKLTRRKQFSDVALAVTGEQALLSKGFIVMDDLTEILPTVDMMVEVTQTNYDRANATSYNPHLDLSVITSEGEAEVPVAFSSQIYGKVSSCTPASVKLNVERYITRRIPVSVSKTGVLNAGLYLNKYDPDPYTLVVSGPQSLVSQVARAAVLLDQSTLSADRMSDRMSLPFELQDSSGAVIASDKINVTNQSVVVRGVTVNTELVPMKRVPVETAGLITGEPAEGYEVTDVWAKQESINIAASQTVLDSLSSVPVDVPLDITGKKAQVTGVVRLKTITSAVNSADIPTQISVTAEIREKQIERTFRNVSIIAEGMSDSQQVSLSHKTTTVQLKGGYAFIQSLSASDILLYVDVRGMSAGSHKLPVQVRIDNASEFTCALNVPEINVNIREK